MRAEKRDIIEIFGHAPDDASQEAQQFWNTSTCPFTKTKCTKSNHENTIIYGVCSVSNGVKKDDPGVIVCPKRLYRDNYQVLQDAIDCVWKEYNTSLVVGGSQEELIHKASSQNSPAIALGQGSGSEVSTKTANGNLSMDWVIQRYLNEHGRITPADYIGIEVQSIDITGNYKDAWYAYNGMHHGKEVDHIPNSGHGLNWANVHKRLIPQIIRKGQIYKKSKRCSGFFFILPEIVFSKFEELLGEIDHQQSASKNNLSILTYKLDKETGEGYIRPISLTKVTHYRLDDIIKAFSSTESSKPALELDEKLMRIK
ncbi:NotI family restriction endonuclease [Endozoicomonas numazuensis]|uniref:NotI family restriction endonuclease n=1 Tax=Endozoicomonas numazuensis TaxID=1137799 RepID=UPI0006895C9C|nr:NotI family restriction endonuclease [Endozoicomonas numazuensis]